MAREVLRLEVSFDGDGSACVADITGCVDNGYFMLSAREASGLMELLRELQPSAATNRRRIRKWRAAQPPPPWAKCKAAASGASAAPKAP